MSNSGGRSDSRGDRVGLNAVAGAIRLRSRNWCRGSSGSDRLLDHQKPYPAVVLDRLWNALRTNRGAPRLFAHSVDLATLPEPRNLLRSVFDPAGLRPWIANWEVVAQTLVQRVFREAVAGIPDRRVLALLEEREPRVCPQSPRRPVTRRT